MNSATAARPRRFSTRSAPPAYHPFANVSVHPGKNTILQYRYATSAPDLRAAKGFDTAPADLSESNPHVTMTPGGQRIERASHNEISLSQRLGSNKFQLALFSDNIHNAALTGTGAAFTADTDFLVGDPYSGNFYYNGGGLHTQGVRAVYSHPVVSGLRRNSRLCLRRSANCCRKSSPGQPDLHRAAQRQAPLCRRKALRHRTAYRNQGHRQLPMAQRQRPHCSRSVQRFSR